HNAMTSTAMIENPGDRTSVRTPILRSRRRVPKRSQLQTSRVCSLITLGLPNARSAAWRASSGASPRSRCSCSSSSRSDCSSRSKSRSRFPIFHHFISALLGCRPHDPRHRVRHPFPLRFFKDKLLSSLIGEPVVLEFSIPIWSHFPFRRDPSPPLQSVQRWVERAVLHLKEIVCSPLNMLSDFVAMSRAIKKGS